MAVRAPTDFESVAIDNLLPRKAVLSNMPSLAVDNQVLVLEKGECLLTSCWRCDRCTTMDAWTTIRRWPIRFPDTCGVHATISCIFTVYCCVESTDEGSCEIALYDGATRSSFAIGGGDETEWKWRGNSGAGSTGWTGITLPGDGTETYLDLQVYTTTPYGYPYIAGLGIFTGEEPS